MTRRLLALLAATAAAVTVAACSSDSGPSASPGATSPATATTEAPADQAVPVQLQFTAKTLDGQEFSGASLLGKPTVLWFWAPWCPVCQREAPMVGQSAEANPEVTFLGVAARDEPAAMNEFVEKYPVKSFSHLADTDTTVWAKFGVIEQPAFAFITADGDVDVHNGTLHEPEFTERVNALTNQ